MEKANQKLRALRALWDGKRGARRMPLSAELDIESLKPWLGNLALIDITEDKQARFRLCGSNLHRRFGGEPTHLNVATLDDDIVGTLRMCIENVRLTRAPSEMTYIGIIDHVPTLFCELCMPLTQDGLTPDTLLFASYRVVKP